MAWKPDYATATELANYIKSGGFGDTDDDVELGLAVAAASRAIDDHTNRQFGKADPAESRVYTARYDTDRCRWVVDIDDLMDQTGLTVTTEDGAITLHALKPGNAAAKGEPWTLLVVDTDSTVQPTTVEDGVTVLAKWGWTQVPGTVKEACLLQGSRFFTRRNAPFGVAGSPELGSEIRLLAKVDPDVAVMLTPYTRFEVGFA